MIAETDLDKVKSVAKMLLMLDVHKTPFSPAIVQHPFTNSGYTMIQENGTTRIADITKSRSDLEKWQDDVWNIIKGESSAISVYMLVNKPYGLTFLKHAKPYLSQKDFSLILADAWIRSENPNMDRGVSRKELIEMFKAADADTLMTVAEREELKTMGDEITVYRGVTELNEKKIRALSWTTDYDKAKWFAERFGENGMVYEAQIKREHVFAYFGSRSESEIIVDPKYLTGIAPAQEPNEGMLLAQ